LVRLSAHLPHRWIVLTTSAVRTNFAFPTPVAITGGTQYAAVISRTGAFSGTNYYNAYRMGSGPVLMLVVLKV
jgi:hypothetical protein